jgi:hypothetical protein
MSCLNSPVCRHVFFEGAKIELQRQLNEKLDYSTATNYLILEYLFKSIQTSKWSQIFLN